MLKTLSQFAYVVSEHTEYEKASSEKEFESAVGAWRRFGLGLGLGSGVRLGYWRKHIAGRLYLRLGVTIASVYSEKALRQQRKHPL